MTALFYTDDSSILYEERSVHQPAGTPVAGVVGDVLQHALIDRAARTVSNRQPRDAIAKVIHSHRETPNKDSSKAALPLESGQRWSGMLGRIEAQRRS